MADRIDNDEDGVWLHCSNSAIRRAGRQLGQLYDDAMGDSGLKGTQFSLLSQIRLLGAPSLKTLANAMVMDLSALGHTLKPLLRDGLVELVPDEQDRRVKRVRLTPLGRAKQKEVAARWKKAQRRFDEVFGEDRSVELRRTLALISSPEFAKAFATTGGDPS
ncbi:MarR family winged helix-turn-helix transcriptional regulator [Rhizobium sp. NTR19]|uniref:MarR family winged helix-turn-helix transcriptional regulator n=1 Tax=Neorhizobium turbinariae TaxID=2937795 RepID=A0ABT0IUH3_9HYPH|nr:MarR family winged helix-turn-helix transcriptional regulator [Neorhizobium turbinariae]MCK8781529.1 MarR family winged helix-turn-helix transcriptional regulator [Neorhizobium turbinariae]